MKLNFPVLLMILLVTVSVDQARAEEPTPSKTAVSPTIAPSKGMIGGTKGKFDSAPDDFSSDGDSEEMGSVKDLESDAPDGGDVFEELRQDGAEPTPVATPAF